MIERRIDAHHHVWDLAVRAQPWMSSEGMSSEGMDSDGMAPIRRSFGVDEFDSVARAHGVSASVVVQTVADVAETEELLDLASVTPLVAGVVGWVDVTAQDVGDQLDCLLARSSGSWLVGIRSLVQYEPDPAWLTKRSVIVGLGEVAARGLCNELLVVPHQLDAVLTAVSEVSEGRFVIDHLAKPPIASRAVGAVGNANGRDRRTRQRICKDLRPGDRGRLVDLDGGRHRTIRRSRPISLRLRATAVRQ